MKHKVGQLLRQTGWVLLGVVRLAPFKMDVRATIVVADASHRVTLVLQELGHIGHVAIAAQDCRTFSVVRTERALIECSQLCSSKRGQQLHFVAVPHVACRRMFKKPRDTVFVKKSSKSKRRS